MYYHHLRLPNFRYHLIDGRSFLIMICFDIDGYCLFILRIDDELSPLNRIYSIVDCPLKNHDRYYAIRCRLAIFPRWPEMARL